MADTTPLVAEIDGVCGGRATIVGTRIEARHVIGWLGCGMTVGEISADYGVTREQVTACLAWAYGLVERHYGIDDDSATRMHGSGNVVELVAPH